MSAHAAARAAQVGLRDFLDDAKLAEHATALVGLGAAGVQDLEDVEDTDLASIGMKVLEIRRFRRKLEEHKAARGGGGGAPVTVGNPVAMGSFEVERAAPAQQGMGQPQMQATAPVPSPMRGMSRPQMHPQPQMQMQMQMQPQMQMQMPQQPQMPQQQMMVQQQTTTTIDSSGTNYQMLAGFDGLFIRQRVILRRQLHQRSLLPHVQPARSR
jgi:hypothetical protein